MNLFEAHADCQAEHQDELGANCPLFHWNGQDWKILPGSAMRRKELSPGGFQLNADLRFTCLVAQFGISAADQSEAMLDTDLSYLGDDYKVESVAVAPESLQLHLQCNSLNQGL